MSDGQAQRSGMLLCGAGVLAVASVSAVPASGLDIVLDYTHDTYFQTNPTAMAALEAAAMDLESVITSVLPERFDSNSVTVGKVTASLDWELSYTNPATGSQISVDPVNIPEDEYRVFVGVRPITQPGVQNATLGQGGVGGVSISSSLSVEPLFPDEISQAVIDIGTAVSQLEAEANANAGRGGVGPTIGTFEDLSFSGSIGSSSFSYSADVSYGVGVGNLWFDVDTDDNGTFDNDTTLDDYWHWNHTTTTSAGKNDFYSVALHELVHTLGFGGSESWDELINPSDPDEWLGATLISLLGTGQDAVESDGAHLMDGLEGNILGTSMLQETVMAPSITVGTRKRLTDLDVAVFDDIGWDVIDLIAEFIDGDYNGDGFVSQADLDLVLLNWGDSAVPSEWLAADQFDGQQVSQNELDGVLLNWGDGTPPINAIPEPATAGLLGLAIWGITNGRTRKRVA